MEIKITTKDGVSHVFDDSNIKDVHIHTNMSYSIIKSDHDTNVYIHHLVYNKDKKGGVGGDSVLIDKVVDKKEQKLGNINSVAIDWRDNTDGTSTAYIDNKIVLLDGEPWIWVPKN